MFPWLTTFLFLCLLAMAANISGEQDADPVRMARAGVLQALTWARASMRNSESDNYSGYLGLALGDCVLLYEEADSRLTRLLWSEGYSWDDASAWLSGAVANHRTCLDGLNGKKVFEGDVANNVTVLLREALALHGREPRGNRKGWRPKVNRKGETLVSWDVATSNADFVVAQDGSGNYSTINAAVVALAKMGQARPERVIIYVKSGVYYEKVEIGRDMTNVMLVGDGINKTIVTNNLNVRDGATTWSSATFGVVGDGFWARDVTLENTAGPEKFQAVALRVSSDLSIFYQCNFKGYQDTLFVHSLRQFYRDCQIYGTIDFMFGDAGVVFQNCDIYVRRPMVYQSNMITAQGRDDPNENTGISIHGSRVRPAPEFIPVEGSFKSYLGRPWKMYSRTVFLKTDLDGLVDPKGWMEWEGSFALSTLFYAEFMNTGYGAPTGNRVKWPGFHVFTDSQAAMPFTVSNFIQGESWIPESGVPFWPGL